MEVNNQDIKPGHVSDKCLRLGNTHAKAIIDPFKMFIHVHILALLWNDADTCDQMYIYIIRHEFTMYVDFIIIFTSNMDNKCHPSWRYVRQTTVIVTFKADHCYCYAH